MKNPSKKVPSMAELKRQLAQVLQELEMDNAWLGMGKFIEQQPVAERIDRLAEIMLQLTAKGEKVRLNVRNWAPELLHELKLNDRIGPKIEQMELKEELLRKHKRSGKRIAPKLKRKPKRRLPG